MNRSEFNAIVEAYDLMNEERIIPTSNWCNSMFDKFNKEMFANSLPKIPVNVPTLNLNNLGEFVSYINEDGTVIAKSININDKFNIPKSIIEDDLIHEMIHLENTIYFTKQLVNDGVPLKIDSHETECFLKEMKRINRDFNRNITKSTDVSDKNIFKLNEKYREKYLKLMSNTLFICVHVWNRKVLVYRIDHSSNENLEKDIKRKFENFKIDTIIPKSIYAVEGNYSTSIDEYMVYDEGEDFDYLKKILSLDILESESENDGKKDKLLRSLYEKKLASNGKFDFKKMPDGGYFVVYP